MACNQLGAGACVTSLPVFAVDTPTSICRWVPTFHKEVIPTGRRIGKTCSRSPLLCSPAPWHHHLQWLPNSLSHRLLQTNPFCCALPGNYSMCNYCLGDRFACLFCCICLRGNLLVRFRGETRMQVMAQNGEGRCRAVTSTGPVEARESMTGC